MGDLMWEGSYDGLRRKKDAGSIRTSLRANNACSLNPGDMQF